MTLYFGGLRLLQRTPEGVYFADLAACNAFEAGPVRAEAVACPTLVVLGNEDKMTGPKQSRAVASSIQGARVVELDCGHAMLSEQSNAVLAALKSIV
jgi:pimeloyl-ACP methyl ester carboxylesterase